METGDDRVTQKVLYAPMSAIYFWYHFMAP
jgi:hypothetical protein